MKRKAWRVVGAAPDAAGHGDVRQPRQFDPLLAAPQEQDPLALTSGVLPTATGPAETSADAAAGFVSRPYFTTRFSAEILRAQRQGHDLTLVLVDSGAGTETAPPSGDAAQPAEVCHRVLAEALPAQLRGFDVMAQWTDTTVALLLLDSDRTGAAAVLQRLANAVAGPHLPGRRLCLRAGIATYPRDGRTVHDLWERALVSLRGVRPA